MKVVVALPPAAMAVTGSTVPLDALKVTLTALVTRLPPSSNTAAVRVDRPFVGTTDRVEVRLIDAGRPEEMVIGIDVLSDPRVAVTPPEPAP